MTQDTQFKLQAYLDGELSPAERAEVEALLRQNGAARDLLTELSHTARVVAEHAAEIKVPETREFYWSKIQREISRPVVAPTPTPTVSFGAWLRRLLVPAGAAAGLAIAVLVSLPRPGGAADLFTATGDAVAFTYENHNTGTTLVWLDFPSGNDFSHSGNPNTLNP
jgi:anti-sigma factor RsiW